MRTKPSVVLPSIHEMFPEHLMASSPARRQYAPQPSPSLATHNSAYRLIPAAKTSHDRRRSISHLVSPVSRSSQLPNGVRPSADAPPNPYPHRSTSTDGSPASFMGAPAKRADAPEYSFDVLRSDPSSSSLQHIASSATFPNRGTTSSGYNPHGEVGSGMAPAFRVSVADSSSSTSHSTSTARPPRSSSVPSGNSRKSPTGTQFSVPYGPGYPSIISFPVTGSTEAGEPARAESPDPGNSSDGDLSSSNGKKHICHTCQKRFNRPSSLRIHINTHTGVTPFRCPWPNCGREFNVNSNMRRHYRNHTSPGFSRPHSNDTRRRRKRQPSQELVFVSSTSSSSISASKPSGVPPDMDDNMSEDGFAEDEIDELDSHMDMDPPPAPFKYTKRTHDAAYHHLASPATHYTQSNIRDSRGASAACSYPPPPSSSSIAAVDQASRVASPSSSCDHLYSPSAAYVHSLTDTRVSTALRPAFRSQPVSPIDGR